MDLITLLLDPKFISIVGPLGIMAIVEGWAIYKLFKLYNSLQESRLTETKRLNEEYIQLTNDINKTLDTLLKVLGNKRNGNGGNGGGQ